MKRKFSTESFHNDLEQLSNRLTLLKSKVKELNERIQTFQAFSNECIIRIEVIKRIETNEIIEAYLDHYLRLYWFQFYLAIKDELYVLIKGELMRSYHKDEHKSMKHHRGHEKSYFVNKYELSACSADGMDFEFRILNDLRPNNTKLNKIALALDEITQELHNYNEQIDNSIYRVKTCIHGFPQVSSVHISNLHNNEFIKINFKHGKRYKLSRIDISIDVSRIVAYSTVIEDPTDLQMTLSDALHSTRAVSLDHDEYRQGNASMQVENSDDIFENNDISLKSIKLAHGVDEDERDKYDSDGNLIDNDDDAMTARLTISKDQKSSDNGQTGLGTDQSTVRTGSEVNGRNGDAKAQPSLLSVNMIVKVVNPLSSETVFKDIKIPITLNVFYSTAKTGNKLITSSNLLDSVMVSLWSQGWYWIPEDIIMEDRIYTRGRRL